MRSPFQSLEDPPPSHSERKPSSGLIIFRAEDEPGVREGQEVAGTHVLSGRRWSRGETTAISKGQSAEDTYVSGAIRS